MFVMKATGSFPEFMRMGSGGWSELQTDNADQSWAVERAR